MRMYRYAYRLFDTLLSVASAIAAFALAVVRYASCWQSLKTLQVSAFKIIAVLHPIYRESYDAHGLSLDHRWRTQ
ncbi:hypothetical protein [Rhizobium yanglingense]